MSLRRFLLWGGLVLVLAIASCARTTPEPVDAPIVPSPSGPTDSPLVPDPLESPPSILPTPLPQALESEAVVESLREAVAQELAEAPEALSLVSVERAVWPDTSLGCPEPDMMYAEVLTEGWLVRFVDAAGEEHPVHATLDGTYYVVCPSPAMPPLETFGQDTPALRAAVDALATSLALPRERISVVSVEAVQWPDSCLGCARPDEMCLMVITPGFRIVLEAEGRAHAVHTDRTGRYTVICEGASADPLPTDR